MLFCTVWIMLSAVSTYGRYAPEAGISLRICCGRMRTEITPTLQKFHGSYLQHPVGEGLLLCCPLYYLYTSPPFGEGGVAHLLRSDRLKKQLDKPSNLSYHHNKFRSIRKRIHAGFGGDAFFDPYADHYDEISLWKGWRKQCQTATTTRPNRVRKVSKAGVEGSDTTLGAGCRRFESCHSDHIRTEKPHCL